MGNSKNYAFVEITFSKETKDDFSNLIAQIVPGNFLYYSPVVERIKGNMANTLHCTLFYGLEPDLIKDSSLIESINNSNINEIQLGNLFFLNGYQNLYKVLCIEVLDPDIKLKNLSERISTYANNMEYEFKPHLTLAYVTSEYSLPEKTSEFVKSLKVEKVKISQNLNL